MKRIWSFTPTSSSAQDFLGGLNWYRNIDETWELTGFLEGAKLRQPSLFIAGDKDPVIEFYADWYKNIAEIMTNLRVNVTLSGVGHWTQQERPAEVSRLMIEFLKGAAEIVPAPREP